tara:strand:+ start:659 stop:1231 length:573 start_codon:yes stop_codon:yes gene_type:complete
MNIFVLDRDPRVAASFHCNKHVVKMILESGQMLCTAHWVHLLKQKNKSREDFKRIKDVQSWLFENTSSDLHPPWKISHINHPCTVWVRENISNYTWLVNLSKGLLREYTRRYNRHHKSEVVIEWLDENIPVDIKDDYLTEFPQCMPDECKVLGNAPLAYKNYYITHKSYMAKWEPRSKTPSWYILGDKDE